MFAIDPVDPNIVYAGTDADGVVRQHRCGFHLVSDKPRPPAGARDWNGRRFGGTLYIASQAGVFRSVDRGVSWTDLHFFAGAVDDRRRLIRGCVRRVDV
jgi:hypothetical protein